MADKTTLERCVEFFEKNGWPGRLRYIAGRHWYLCHHYSDTSMYAQLNDNQATAIITQHLWEIIKKEQFSFRMYQQNEQLIYCLNVVLKSDDVAAPCHTYKGPDELELMLQAAMEIDHG